MENLFNNLDFVREIFKVLIDTELTSNCVHRHVGSILFSKSGKILSLGANITPAPSPCIESSSCTKHFTGLCPVIHSEVNCILNYYQMHIDNNLSIINDCFNPIIHTNEEPSIMLATYSPCYECSKMLVRNKIQNVVYLYKHHRTIWKYLEECGIKLMQLDENMIKLYEEMKEEVTK